MPPSASAKRPFLFAVRAGEGALARGRTARDSSSVSGIAAQFTLTNGTSRSALRSWIARATSSLPVPVSPVMSTVLFDLRDELRPCESRPAWPAAADDAVVIELLVALG